MTMKEKISRFEKDGYRLTPKKFKDFVLLIKSDNKEYITVKIYKHSDNYSWSDGVTIRNGNFKTGEVSVQLCF